MAHRSPDAVGARVAAANDDDMLARGEDRLIGRQRLPGDAPVLLRQKIHGEMNAAQFASRNGKIAGLLGAAGQNDGVVPCDEVLRLRIDPDMHIVMKDDAFGFHLRDAAVDQMLLHLEIGNAVAQQPARFRVFLVDMDVMAGARELLGRGKPPGAGANDGDALARLSLGRLGRNPALVEAAIDDGAFDGLDGDRLILKI